jgi:hypothetical protein
LVGVQIKKWKYRKESEDYFIVYLLNSQRRKHTHTKPTHINRQTEKAGAWGRPRLLHTVFKMLFFRSFVTCHCVTISRRSESKLLRESLEFMYDLRLTNNASVLCEGPT